MVFQPLNELYPVRLLHCVVDRIRHDVAEAVYAANLKRKRFHYRLHAAELLAQQLRRALTYPADSQCEHQSVKARFFGVLN